MNVSIPTAILDFIFPRRCRICSSPMSDLEPAQGYLCKECSAKIPWIETIRCPFCSSIIPDRLMVHDNRCVCCRTKNHLLAGIIALVQYHDPDAKRIRDSILQLKHADRTSFARDAGKLLAQKLTSSYPDRKFSGAVPVPLHKSRLSRRGYNQSALISHYLAKNLSIPCLDWLIDRIKRTPPQSGNPASRSANVKNAFVVNGTCQNAHILLVDDVLTTGATISECARVLKESGAESVTSAVIAWVPLRKEMEDRK
jgi:competence protein ComFC